MAGVPTTAARPAYAYPSRKTASVMQRLIDAGYSVGKTNLDQFATSVNGTRSPFGACHTVLNPDYVSHG